CLVGSEMCIRDSDKIIGAVKKWLIILPQPYFNWDIPLKDYLTFISIDLVWIPNNLAALEGNEPP
ncbi:hypothetical protein, partial [Dialister hominis]|uniref:hypothetical protein n=1 Tax=Dialister hominis TaxID=2582419 RepID=UPI003FD72BDE